MVDARWYMILKEFEYTPKNEPGADLVLPKHNSPGDSTAASSSRKLKLGLVLTALLLAAILISSLPAI